MSTFPEIEGKQRKGNKLCHHIWKLCQLLKSCRADMALAEAAARRPTPGPKSTDATAHGQALPPSHRAAMSPGEETVPTGAPGRTMLARKRFPRVGLAGSFFQIRARVQPGRAAGLLSRLSTPVSITACAAWRGTAEFSALGPPCGTTKTRWPSHTEFANVKNLSVTFV